MTGDRHLRIVDAFGADASLNVERDRDADLSVWVAEPGRGDGYSVCLSVEARRRLAAYLLDGLQ